MAVVDNITAASSINEVTRGVVAVIDPRVVIAVNVGVAADGHGSIVLYMTATGSMHTCGSDGAVVDDNRVAVLSRQLTIDSNRSRVIQHTGIVDLQFASLHRAVVVEMQTIVAHQFHAAGCLQCSAFSNIEVATTLQVACAFRS